MTKSDQIKELYYKTKIPKFFQGYKFPDNLYTGSDNFHRIAIDILRDKFSDKLRFKIISGNHNVGKTVLLSCLANTYCEEGINVLYVKEDDLINHEEMTWTAQGIYKTQLPMPYMYRMSEKKNGEFYNKKVGGVLLFDELGCQSYIDNDNYKYKNLHNKMNNYIDKILDRGIYVVFATNYKVDRLIERVGQKFWARIEKGGFKTYEF